MEWTREKIKKVKFELKRKYDSIHSHARSADVFSSDKNVEKDADAQWAQLLKSIGIQTRPREIPLLCQMFAEYECHDLGHLFVVDPMHVMYRLKISEETAEKILILGL